MVEKYDINYFVEQVKIKARLFGLSSEDFEKAVDEAFESWKKDYKRYRSIKWQ